MKKITTSLFFLLLSLLTYAGPISEQSARQIAMEFLNSGKTGKKIKASKESGSILHVAKISQEEFYVFNIGQENGFVIVAAEELSQPVLGYSTQGTFDATTISPEMKAWLNDYEMQLKAIRDGKAKLPEQTDIHTAIEPMVTSQWSQESPYNLLLKTSSSQYVTGCVATAMAQIMYYHQWPEQVTESLKSPDGLMLNLEPTSFNWDVMRDQYNSTDTDDGAQEVAKLMKYCGYAAKMNYGQGSSGAQSADAVEGLRRFLSYNYTTEEVMRADYTSSEWDKLIYNELANNRPVLYTGYSAEGGHAFVCDGYDGNGMYHINWGWGGMSDTFFVLSLLNPDEQGTGGYPGTDGYSIWQSAIIGIQKATMDFDGIRLGVNQVTSNSTLATRSSSSDNFVVTTGITLSTVEESIIGNTYDFALALYQGNKLIQTTELGNSTVRKRMGAILPISFNNKEIVIPNTLPNGTYQLRVLQRKSGTEDWLKLQYAECIYLHLTIEGNTMSIQNVSNYTILNNNLTALQVSSYNINGTRRANSPLEFMLTVKNTGSFNTGLLDLYYSTSAGFETNTDGITTEAVSRIGVNIDPGQTDNIPMHYTPQSSGTYYFRIVNPATNDILEEFPVEILTRAPVSLSATQNPVPGTILKEGYRNYYDYNNTNLTISYEITNNGSDTFEEYLYAFLFSKNVDDDSFGSSNQYKTSYTSIPAGETATVAFTFPDLDDNKDYIVNLYYNNNGSLTGINVSDIQRLYINHSSNSILNVLTGKMIYSDYIYDIQGRYVGTDISILPKGIYIHNGKKVVK